MENQVIVTNFTFVLKTSMFVFVLIQLIAAELRLSFKKRQCCLQVALKLK